MALFRTAPLHPPASGKNRLYMKINYTLIVALLLIFFYRPANAQATKNLVYVDPQGRLRWEKDHTEVYLFGVNYTVPFAYGYRSMKALHKDIEKEIDEDVYHMARMGVDAFRVHIWDTEISDSTGNLINNEHLKLFDYFLYRLKERNIRVIITYEAFYGNGYPQKDEKSNGFSAKYGKGNAGLNEVEIKAQENYITQLITHVNPYTHLNYRDEPNIIGAEINNEPSHSGPKSGVTAYINRLVATARNTGWTKPLFYNISQNPYYADAVARSNVNGYSFQWYPTGLVAGHEQHGNFLPNVDHYQIPFIDTIPEFKNKARMVYEFDAADVLQSCIYPAVARSFKKAGFQWVTQFAYDPMGTAYGNTEYQTHFLNLAYTPSKSISFLIANRVFHLLPGEKNYGTYPADSTFDAYHVSYRQNLSEMNTAVEFYYSNNTQSAPVNIKTLQHIAGVGSSAIVKYKGYGAYFIDKLQNGVWRLEVMPDAITIRDPFERPSPAREVVHIQWQQQPMEIKLDEIGGDFSIKGLNKDNQYQTSAANGSFIIKPGTYLISRKGLNAKLKDNTRVGVIGLEEFIAPETLTAEPYVTHTPAYEAVSGKDLSISAKIINIDSTAAVTLNVSRPFGGPLAIPMTRLTPYDYRAEIPAAQVTSGLISYSIIIKQGSQYLSFPGAHKGDPAEWDHINTDTWQTFIASPHSKLMLFNAVADREMVNPYFPGFSRRGGPQFVSGEESGQLAFKVSAPQLKKGQDMGMQLYIGNKAKGRTGADDDFSKIAIRAASTDKTPVSLRLALTDVDGATYSAYVTVDDQYKNLEIPLTAFKPDSAMLLPRPYPEFQALWFKSASFNGLKWQNADKLELTIGNNLQDGEYNKPLGIEIEKVWLEQ